MANEYYFFAGDLIDWNFESKEILIPVIDTTMSREEQWLDCDQMKKFMFRSEYVNSIDYLITKALKLSPVKKACILTDTQFGPEIPQYKNLKGVSEFWAIHMKGLEWNTMYIIDSGNFCV